MLPPIWLHIPTVDAQKFEYGFMLFWDQRTAKVQLSGFDSHEGVRLGFNGILIGGHVRLDVGQIHQLGVRFANLLQVYWGS